MEIRQGREKWASSLAKIGSSGFISRRRMQ